MKTIFVLIVAGMLSGCVAGTTMVRFEDTTHGRRGAFTRPNPGISFRSETQKEVAAKSHAWVSQNYCDGSPIKVIGESYDANHGALTEFECDKAESAKTPSASP